MRASSLTPHVHHSRQRCEKSSRRAQHAHPGVSSRAQSIRVHLVQNASLSACTRRGTSLIMPSSLSDSSSAVAALRPHRCSRYHSLSLSLRGAIHFGSGGSGGPPTNDVPARVSSWKRSLHSHVDLGGGLPRSPVCTMCRLTPCTHRRHQKPTVGMVAVIGR